MAAGPACPAHLAADAGVGAASQEQALCGQLVQRLSQHHTVQWCVLAVNGLDSPGLMQLLKDSPAAQFDVVVLSVGASDATGLCAPLRWLTGRWARQMNTTLQSQLADQGRRTLHWHPESTTSAGMAADGLHPNHVGYSVWADGLSQHILAAQATLKTALLARADQHCVALRTDNTWSAAASCEK